jgi:hypothetical protein
MVTGRSDSLHCVAPSGYREGMRGADMIDPPPSFPRRTFGLIAVAWMALDIAVMLLLWRWAAYGRWFPLVEIVAIAWQALLAAKLMLMLGWWFLGEGRFGHRLAGLLLFLPLLVPLLIGAFFDADVIGILAAIVFFGGPVLFIVGWPYLVLQLMEYRFARDAPRSTEKIGQFTVRQLMLITLVAAIVLGVLRWAQQANLSYAVVGLLLPLLGWVFPPVACLGLLHERWYPRVVYAAGLTAWLLALPLFALSNEDARLIVLFVGVYTLTFCGHLLLLRGLGFRLVNYRPRVYYDPGVIFIDPEEPGIVWVGDGRGHSPAVSDAEVFDRDFTNRRSSS